jgi:hypothetical protein
MDLLAYAKKGEAGLAENECNIAVNEFLLGHFARYAVSSTDPASIIFPEDSLQEVVNWADLLVKGRAEIIYEDGSGQLEPIKAQEPEGAYKVINYLKELALGHALINERNEINEDDLKLVSHVAISSIPGHLRPIIRELRKVDYVDTRICQTICNVSGPTARYYLLELDLLGIGTLIKGSPKSNQPDKIYLSDDFL